MDAEEEFAIILVIGIMIFVGLMFLLYKCNEADRDEPEDKRSKYKNSRPVVGHSFEADKNDDKLSSHFDSVINWRNFWVDNESHGASMVRVYPVGEDLRSATVPGSEIKPSSIPDVTNRSPPRTDTKDKHNRNPITNG